MNRATPLHTRAGQPLVWCPSTGGGERNQEPVLLAVRACQRTGLAGSTETSQVALTTTPVALGGGERFVGGEDDSNRLFGRRVRFHDMGCRTTPCRGTLPDTGAYHGQSEWAIRPIATSRGHARHFA